MGAIDAVDQQAGVGLHAAVGVGVAQPDAQLLDFHAEAELLHAVVHLDVDQLGELVNRQVPLVPELQGVVAVDVALADFLVQVPDVVQEVVDLLHVVLQHGHRVVVFSLQLAGVAADFRAQGRGHGADGAVILLLAGLVHQLLQGVVELAELQAQDAEAVLILGRVALAHLVQDHGNPVQAVQHAVHIAHLGVFLAEADVQIGAADLGDAVHQDALTHADIALGVIPVAARSVQADLVHPLAGVAGGVDVGNIIARHRQSGLGGVNRQTGLGEGTKGTNAHLVKLLYMRLRRGSRFSWTGAEAPGHPCHSRGRSPQEARPSRPGRNPPPEGSFPAPSGS